MDLVSFLEGGSDFARLITVVKVISSFAGGLPERLVILFLFTLLQPNPPYPEDKQIWELVDLLAS